MKLVRANQDSRLRDERDIIETPYTFANGYDAVAAKIAAFAALMGTLLVLAAAFPSSV